MAALNPVATPFKSLTSDILLGWTTRSCVFAISQRIAFKCPLKFERSTPENEKMVRENVKGMDEEKQIYGILAQHRHPSFVHGILIAPEGIFLERLACSLLKRMADTANRPTLATKCRWIKQSIGALAWLEQLGLAHGDLRPINIMLDAEENAKLIDFDCTVRVGDNLKGFFEAYSKPGTKQASAVTEQYAFASCVYFIRHGYEVLHDIDPQTRYEMLEKYELPSTDDDEIFGSMVSRCWNAEYHSMKQLCDEVDALTASWREGRAETLRDASEPNEQLLLAECEDFLLHRHLTMEEWEKSRRERSSIKLTSTFEMDSGTSALPSPKERAERVNQAA